MGETPVVFLSHSSRDKSLLVRFRSMLEVKSGGRLALFLSCDGQSIPFGRNWVYAVEDALRLCQLMFVFLSPASLRSHWTLFEAGFAYAKRIKVVPVGILGIDLSTVPPPLSLLQGFNVDTLASLNNIPHVITNTLEVPEMAEFSAEEFRELLQAPSALTQSTLGELASTVAKIAITLEGPASGLVSVAEARESIHLAFKEFSREIQGDGSSVTSHGIVVSATGSPDTRVSIEMDPALTAITFPIVDRILFLIREQGVDGAPVVFHFQPWISCIEGNHRISAQLYDVGIGFGDDHRLVWKGLQFRIGRFFNFRDRQRGSAYLDVVASGSHLAEMEVRGLLELLFERGLLFSEDAVSF